MFIDSNALVLNSMVLKLADVIASQLAPEFKAAQIAPARGDLVLAAQSAVCVLLASKPAQLRLADPQAEPTSPEEPAPLPKDTAAPPVIRHRRGRRPGKPITRHAATGRPPHSSGKEHRCPHCTETFKLTGWLNRHMLKVHGTLLKTPPAPAAVSD